MRVLPAAEFSTTLPEDGVETEDGSDFLQLPGQGVTAALAEILRKLGCSVSEPINAGDHGWELHIRAEKRNLWLQVTMIEDYWLVLEDRTFRLNFGKPHRVYLDVLQRFATAMAADPRFTNLRWYTLKTVLSGAEGSPTPVIP